MADLVFVSIVIAFFAAAGGFVVLCDRIVGSVDHAAAAPMSEPPVEIPPAKAA